MTDKFLANESVFLDACTAYESAVEKLGLFKLALSRFEFELSQIDGSIDYQVAFDPALKNDLQRKAKITQLQFENEAWVNLTKQIAAQKRMILEAEAKCHSTKYAVKFYSDSTFH